MSSRECVRECGVHRPVSTPVPKQPSDTIGVYCTGSLLRRRRDPPSFTCFYRRRSIHVGLSCERIALFRSHPFLASNGRPDVGLGLSGSNRLFITYRHKTVTISVFDSHMDAVSMPIDTNGPWRRQVMGHYALSYRIDRHADSNRNADFPTCVFNPYPVSGISITHDFLE